MWQDVCGQSHHAERESIFSVQEQINTFRGLFTGGVVVFLSYGGATCFFRKTKEVRGEGSENVGGHFGI